MKKKLIVMAALTVITVIMVTLFFAWKAPQALGSVWGVREVLISAPLLFVLFGLPTIFPPGRERRSPARPMRRRRRR